MKTGLVAFLTAAGVLTSGLFLLPNNDAAASGNAIPERWVNANHLQIQHGGQWVDVPLMPLDSVMCLSPDFEKYCD